MGRVKESRLEVRCRRCGRTCKTAESRASATCGPCEREDPALRRESIRRRTRRAQLLAAARRPKHRRVISLQMAHNGNIADCYHDVIPRYMIETLGWAKGARLRVAVVDGRVIYEPVVSVR